MSTAETTSRNKKILYAVGGGLALAVTGYLLKRLFFGSGSQEDSDAIKKMEEELRQKHQQQQQQQQQSPKVPEKPSIFSAPPEADTHKNNAENLSQQSKEQLEARINALRVEGNSRFSEGRLDHAIQCYQECIDLADFCGTDAAFRNKAPAMANAVSCFLGQERWQSAEHAASLLIHTATFDYAERMLRVKAYWRRAKARLNLGEYDRALEDCAKAEEEAKPDSSEAMNKTRAEIASLVKEALAEKAKRAGLGGPQASTLF